MAWLPVIFHLTQQRYYFISNWKSRVRTSKYKDLVEANSYLARKLQFKSTMTARREKFIIM
jgi:hypothetical protein